MFYSLYQGNNIARVIAWVIAIISCVGNGCILYRILVYRYRRYRFYNRNSTRDYYITAHRSLIVINDLICHLALAGLLGGLYLMLISSADLYYGINYPQIYQIPPVANATNLWATNPLCFAARFFHFTSTELSIWTTFVIGIDRFIILIGSNHRLTRFKCYIVMIISWIIFCLMGLYVIVQSLQNMPIYRNRFSLDINLCIYQDTNLNSTLNVTILREYLYYFCCCFLVLLYVTTIIHSRCQASDTRTSFDLIERHIIPLVAIISISNMASMLPEAILIILRKLSPSIIINPIYHILSACAKVFTFFNTAINPLIYILYATPYHNINISRYFKSISCFKWKNGAISPT